MISKNIVIYNKEFNTTLEVIMKELTTDNLEQILSSNKKVIVQYGASWCGACRVIKPKFSKLSEAANDVAFYYVDAEVYPNSRSFAKVDNLPTFAGFVNGELVKQASGTKEESIQGVLNEIASH
ncbi:MAG: thiol-disulfide isomerase/thioredoxin [Bacteriovoracaceae bacterium]|jgi:thiol-disulfide isomerase/thioredoxin